MASLQSKKKLKDKSEQLLGEAKGGQQPNAVKYEDSRNVVGFEKSLKSGVMSQNLNTSMRNATIKSDHMGNMQNSMAKNSGAGEAAQRILGQKPQNNGISKMYASGTPG